MKTEFKKAVLPDEISSLKAFDRRVFSSSDAFDTAEWENYEAYWMVVNGTKVGCCAFERHVDFQDDITEVGNNPPLQGSLYISTTGILPEFQGKGFGQLLKAWEVSYARYHGFTRIITDVRKSNLKMIRLNRRFNFQVIRTTRRYYTDPVESTCVMELLL